MSVQPDPASEAVVRQAKSLAAALDRIEARLNEAGPAPNLDQIARALAEPVRALGEAAKEV